MYAVLPSHDFPHALGLDLFERILTVPVLPTGSHDCEYWSRAVIQQPAGSLEVDLQQARQRGVPEITCVRRFPLFSYSAQRLPPATGAAGAGWSRSGLPR